MIINASIEIGKRPDDVFPWLSDVDKAMKWQRNVKSQEIIEKAEHFTGTKFKEIIEEDGNSLDMQGVITKYVLNQKYPALSKTMIDWSKSDNIWLRRVAIDFQLQYKEEVNVDLLEEIICNNFASSVFFINKAIGWSLRDYSKVNPAWVANFIERHKNELPKLSIKEASKYL